MAQGGLCWGISCRAGPPNRLMSHYVFAMIFLTPSTLGIGWVVYHWVEWHSWKRTTGRVLSNEKTNDGEHPFLATAEFMVNDQVHTVVSDLGRAVPHKIGEEVVIIYPAEDVAKARFYYASYLPI